MSEVFFYGVLFAVFILSFVVKKLFNKINSLNVQLVNLETKVDRIKIWISSHLPNKNKTFPTGSIWFDESTKDTYIQTSESISNPKWEKIKPVEHVHRYLNTKKELNEKKRSKNKRK